MDKITIQTYNQSAQDYDDETSDFWDRFPRTFLDEFINLGKGKVLDLGCGPGRDGLLIQEKGCEVICFDASEEMLKLCKEKGLTTIQGDFMKLPFDKEEFDGVWAYAALLHISKKEFPKALKEIHRVLKADSALAIGMIEGTEEFYKNSVNMGQRWFSYYTHDELIKYLEDAGFQIIYQEEFKPRSKNYFNILCMKIG